LSASLLAWLAPSMGAGWLMEAMIGSRPQGKVDI
jgi:hypothetical protein